MKIIIMLVLAVLFSGCAERELRKVDGHERTLYEHGIDALGAGEYAKAQDFFTKLLQEFPTNRWLSSSYYNLGFSLENQGKYPEAIAQYKNVIDYYQGIHSREETEALYRLSVCYEALNDDQRVVLTLLQLKNGLRFLSREIVEAEWPARLAGAYARQGRVAEAQEYYTQAQLELKKTKHALGNDQLRWLPKTYYSMGHTPEARLKFQNQTELEGFLSGMENSQVWLLKAAESKVSPWSEKASEELIATLDVDWNYIDRLPPENSGDAMLALKKKQIEQKALATRLDTVLQNLKTEKSPDSSATLVFSHIKDLQKRIDLLIGGKEVQDQPTEENKARHSEKQRGRMRK